MKNTHPVSPRIGTSSLEDEVNEEDIKILHSHMVEVVVEDLVTVLCILHGEVVAGTNKEEVSNNITDHLLIQVTIINMLPVSVLKKM